MEKNFRELNRFLMRQRAEGKIKVVSMAQPVNPATIERLPTGVDSIDAILHGGLPRGQLSIICGPTHTGKSSLASLVLARSLSNSDKYALMFAGEKTEGEVLFDVARQMAGSRMRKIGNNEYCIPDSDFAAIRQVMGMRLTTISMLERNRLVPRNRRLSYIQSTIEEAAAAGVEIIVIDPLMMLVAAGVGDPEIRANTDIERQVLIGTWLEDIAREYNIWVVLVAHYRKGTASDVTGPEMIAGSSAVPNCAGTIIEYNRFSVSEVRDNAALEYQRRVKIWKNRGFGTLDLIGQTCIFDAPSTRIGSNPAGQDGSQGYTADGDCADANFRWWERLQDGTAYDPFADPYDPPTNMFLSEIDAELAAIDAAANSGADIDEDRLAALLAANDRLRGIGQGVQA